MGRDEIHGHHDAQCVPIEEKKRLLLITELSQRLITTLSRSSMITVRKFNALPGKKKVTLTESHYTKTGL